jgi:hypothetical protein
MDIKIVKTEDFQKTQAFQLWKYDEDIWYENWRYYRQHFNPNPNEPQIQRPLLLKSILGTLIDPEDFEEARNVLLNGDEDDEERVEKQIIAEDLARKVNVTGENRWSVDAFFDDIRSSAQPNHIKYIAYLCMDERELYPWMGLTFEIRQEKRKGQKPETTLEIGILTRFMLGIGYFLDKLDVSKKMEKPHRLVKRVIKYAREAYQAEFIEMQPISPASLAMWHDIVVDEDIDPFYESYSRNEMDDEQRAKFDSKTLEDAKKGKRYLHHIELYKTQFRICSSCDWFAPYTVDHPTLKNQLFFCGQECLKIKWKNL